MNQQWVSSMFENAVQAARAGDLGAAEKLCATVLQSDPKHAGACDLLAVVKLLQGKAAEAIELAKRAVALRPGAAEFWNNLGACYRAGGDLEAAATAFGRAAEIQPRYAGAL